MCYKFKRPLFLVNRYLQEVVIFLNRHIHGYDVDKLDLKTKIELHSSEMAGKAFKSVVKY